MGKSYWIIIVLIAMLMVSSCGNIDKSDDSNYSPSVEQDDVGSEKETSIEQSNPNTPYEVIKFKTDENGFVWRVEPTLEYGYISFCGWCNTFCVDDHYGYRIDVKTGLTIEEPWVFGHGGDERRFLYDEKKELYGHYDSQPGDYTLELWPENEFIENFTLYSNKIIAFQEIDSDKIEERNYGDPWTSYYLDDAYLSKKYAIALGATFLSDFVYDNDGSYNYDYYPYVDSVITMQFNNLWGVLNKHGSVVVPFIFEHIAMIDEETAFAKYNGKYGILDVSKTSMECLEHYITTDNVNLREGPDTEFVRITTVPSGQTVIVTNFLDGEWFLVVYKGLKGYMKAEFLVEFSNSINSSSEDNAYAEEDVAPEQPEIDMTDWKQVYLDYFSQYVEEEDYYGARTVFHCVDLNSDGIPEVFQGLGEHFHFGSFYAINRIDNGEVVQRRLRQDFNELLRVIELATGDEFWLTDSRGSSGEGSTRMLNCFDTSDLLFENPVFTFGFFAASDESSLSNSITDTANKWSVDESDSLNDISFYDEANRLYDEILGCYDILEFRVESIKLYYSENRYEISSAEFIDFLSRWE